MTTRKKWVLVIVMLSYLVTAIDCSILFTGETKIAADLKLGQSALSWVQNAYVLAYGGFMLLGGRLGDSLGRKRIFCWALVLFGIGSLLAGLSQSIVQMVAARLLQGLGAAVLAPSALALLIDYFKGKERVTAIAWYSSVSGLGMCIGLLLGGAFADFLSWRYGFIVNVPLTLFMLVLSLRVLKGAPIVHSYFDGTGTLWSVVGLFSLVYSINGASCRVRWMLLAAVSLCLFVHKERKASLPIVPLRLFAVGFRYKAYLARLLFAGAMMGFYFFVSEHLQTDFHYTSLQIGLAFFPLTLFTFLGALLVPHWVERWGNQRVLLAGLLLLLVAFAGSASLAELPNYWLAIALPMVLMGFGQGLATSPMTNLGIKDTRPEDAGAASGLVNAAHQIGCSIGLSVMVTGSAALPSISLIYAFSMKVAFVLIAAALSITFIHRHNTSATLLKK